MVSDMYDFAQEEDVDKQTVVCILISKRTKTAHSLGILVTPLLPSPNVHDAARFDEFYHCS